MGWSDFPCLRSRNNLHFLPSLVVHGIIRIGVIRRVVTGDVLTIVVHPILVGSGLYLVLLSIGVGHGVFILDIVGELLLVVVHGLHPGIVAIHRSFVHGIPCASVRCLLLVEIALVLLHFGVVLGPALVGLLLFAGIVGRDLLWIVLRVDDAVQKRPFGGFVLVLISGERLHVRVPESIVLSLAYGHVHDHEQWFAFTVAPFSTQGEMLVPGRRYFVQFGAIDPVPFRHLWNGILLHQLEAVAGHLWDQVLLQVRADLHGSAHGLPGHLIAALHVRVIGVRIRGTGTVKDLHPTGANDLRVIRVLWRHYPPTGG